MKLRTLEYRENIAGVDPRVRMWIAAGGVVGFTLLTALGAQIAIPVPGTPVPITLQTLFVLLAGITLGPRLGTVSMAFYLLLGTVGYHVFALGSWGLATVCGATGGYLVGFVLAQPIVGVLARSRPRAWRRVFVAVVAGNAIIFAAGLAWLSLWLGTGLRDTLALGLWPFMPGLLAKTIVATGAGTILQKSAARRKGAGPGAG